MKINPDMNGEACKQNTFWSLWTKKKKKKKSQLTLVYSYTPRQQGWLPYQMISHFQQFFSREKAEFESLESSGKQEECLPNLSTHFSSCQTL